MAILSCGDKILIAHRRLFEGDSLRFFLGTVTDYEAGVMKIEGKSCVQDPATGGVFIKEDLRTKLYSLQSGTILAYNLPASVSIDELEFMGHLGRLSLRDKSGFQLDLAEQFENMPGSAESRKWSLFAP